MLSQVFDALRKKTETRRHGLLEFAYQAAGNEAGADPEAIAQAIMDHGLTREQFTRLVETCRRRMEMREALRRHPELERRRAEIEKEIAKHDRKLEAAEEAHAVAVQTLHAEHQAIKRELRNRSSHLSDLLNNCPDKDLQARYTWTVDRISSVEARLEELEPSIASAESRAELDPHGLKPNAPTGYRNARTDEEAKAILEAIVPLRNERDALKAELAKLRKDLPRLETQVLET